MQIGISSTIVATLLLAAGPSMAQVQAVPGMGGGGNSVNSIGGKSPPPSAPRAQPPPALPGATQNAARVAPSFRPPADMEPTEALFDAINRGDIASARDAISRGAELNGRNILGMTPMELSVDLGRNDISFLLLSMRGGDDLRGRQPGSAQAATKPVAGKPAARSPVASAKAPVPAKAPVSAQPQSTQQTARLFSGDGGTPIPNAGFLGFDTNRR